MERKEFKTQKEYLNQLKAEKRDANTETVKSKEFNSLLSALVSKYPNLLIRDFLDVDKTFAVALPVARDYGVVDLAKHVELYQDVCDTVTFTTYTKVKQTGLVRIQANSFWEAEASGFWILVS